MHHPPLGWWLQARATLASTAYTPTLHAGATGAGQGYLWLAHRAAGSPLWDLAARSMALWRQVLLQGGQPELTPAAVEWQGCGSLLLASSAEESWGLQARQAALQAAGLEARWLPARELAQLEPALRLAAEGSALLVPSDAQVNGRQTAAALQRACESFGRRFTALFHEPAQALLTGTSGRVEGVATGARRVAAPRGVVVAAGAWSAGFLAEAVGQPAWRGAFLPRKGLLLEMPRPRGMPQLHYAMMEAGYTKHYAPTPAAALAGGSSRSESSGTESSGSESNSSSSSGSKASTQTSSSETLSSLPPAAAAAAADITFTATTSAAGTLLVGSSREFSGWDTEADAAVVAAIMQRAAAFLPGLEGVPRGDISVRVGLRPYAVVSGAACVAGNASGVVRIVYLGMPVECGWERFWSGASSLAGNGCGLNAFQPSSKKGRE